MNSDFVNFTMNKHYGPKNESYCPYNREENKDNLEKSLKRVG
jgi:hypothetical protein